MTALRFARVLLAASSIPFCGSCDRQPTDGGPPAHAPQITGATLVAGGEGIVTGINLDLLPSSITVDGHGVVATLRTAAEIRFAMPAKRPCEVDGRAVQIASGTASYGGRLTVPSVLRMHPGESRILGASDLAACLEFPAGDQSFVITALNPSITEAPGVVPLFTVHTWTSAGAPSGNLSTGRAASAMSATSQQQPLLAITLGDDWYQTNPASFDPRYATASPGDTVAWVDFRSPQWYANGNVCDEPRSQVPTFNAVVAAQSASGRTVIAYDARTAYPGTWNSEATRSRLTRLADIVERWTLPAVREVFDPAFEPIRGAGGRWWHIFRTGVAQPTVDQAGLPQSMCPHFSEVATTLGPDSPPTTEGQVEVLAGYLIHEYGHHADDVIAVRRWGNVFGRGAPGWGAIGESWAQMVQETAARLASGQATGARHDRLTTGVPYADFYGTGYGERPDLSPWGGGRGAYDHGTRLLMFLREQWGDAPLGTNRTRFYQQALALPSYDFPSLASLVGLDATTALDRWSLAEATDDLVAPDVAAARGLPQLRTWVPQDREPPFQVSRTVNATYPVAVARGSYAALYLFAAGELGVSVTITNVTSVPKVVRVTRLR
ncbi:MAG TPA: hypothetical protein VF584_24140 [Longimicrobium sp.]|jgi:hypothetical protein